MNQRTDDRGGPFRFKLGILLIGLFAMRLAVPNSESTRVQVAVETNQFTLPTTALNLQHLAEYVFLYVRLCYFKTSL